MKAYMKVGERDMQNENIVATVSTLKDHNGNIKYPRTVGSAVALSDAFQNKTLEEQLISMQNENDSNNDVSSLLENQKLLMLIVSNMYEENEAQIPLLMSMDLIEEGSSFQLTDRDKYMIGVYEYLINTGLKTVDEVPVKLKAYINS